MLTEGCASKTEGPVAQAGADAFAAVVADAAFSVELVTSHVVELQSAKVVKISMRYRIQNRLHYFSFYDYPQKSVYFLR